MEIYFAQIREDSLIERELMQKEQPARIAVVGSGGCTAFSVLNSSVEKLYCVDINPAQCALVELKKAGIKALDRSGFLKFIGESASGNRLETYNSLKNSLPAYAREYWDADPKAIEAGINKCGVTEKFYSFISQQILTHIYDKEVWQTLFNCNNLQDQRQIYQEYFSGENWYEKMLPLLSKSSHLQFFPAFMFAQAAEDDFGRFFLQQFQNELNQKLVKDNYFLSQFLFGTYLPDQAEGMPFYLSENGYELARKNLDKMEVIPAGLNTFLQNESGIDAFFLSNIFDWSTEESRYSICESIINSASENATVLYRNMLSEPPLPSFFTQRFNEDPGRSAYFHSLERSMIYRKVAVGTIR